MAVEVHEELSALAPTVLAELQARQASALVQVGRFDTVEVLLNEAESRTGDDKTRAVIADAWFRLARALRSAGDADRAAAALRRASDLGSLSAVVEFAQQLQRQGQIASAIERWRQAVQLAPTETRSYLNLARALERFDQPHQALATYLELLEAVPSMATRLMLAERLDALAPRLSAHAHELPTVRIALLGNATLDYLQSYVKIECYKAGLQPSIYQAGFDQYSREILDPDSGLYAFQPDVVVCAIHASRVFGQLHEYPFDLTVDERQAEVERGLATLQQLLDTFAERSTAMVLLHNMVVPQHPALGILDLRDEFGQVAAFTAINTRLAELARTRYRNVFIVDEEGVQARAGKASASDERLWLTARIPWSDAVLAGLSREYMRYVRAARGLSRKCVVLDLDNTLWGGVIGEDGLAGIQLGSEAPGSAFVAFQRELLKLWRRGVLLAICSKNNSDDALQVFEQHPEMILRLSHFAAQRINWESKPANLRELARELNIGTDSLVFLDDNPVERARMRAELPEVLTPEMPADPAGFRRALLEITDHFDTLALTAEDRQRNQLYAQEVARREAQAQLAQIGSVDDYLADLDMVVEIEPVTPLTLPRVAQLTGKTNQFNLTTRRYTEAEIVDKRDRGGIVLTARVRDRFGDNGLTGVAIIEPIEGVEGIDAAVWNIDTLLLSCRVMGRGVETALLAQLAEAAHRGGATRLRGTYAPTPKNAVVRDLYGNHGFVQIATVADGATTWELDVTNSSIQIPNWLDVRTPVPA